MKRSFDRSANGLYAPARGVVESRLLVNPYRFAGGGGGPSTFLNCTSSTCVHLYESDDITQLFQDSALTTPVTANNDPVGGWKDKGTLGEHWLQATSGLRPLYKTGLVNSKPGIVFDGTDDQLSKTLSSLGAHTGFIVLRSDTGAGNYGTLLMDSSGTSGAQVHTAPGIDYKHDVYSSADHLSSVSEALDTYSAMTFDYDGAGTMNAWSGVTGTPTQFMTAVTGIYASGAKVYGCIGGHGGEYLKGAILLMVIYNTVLSSPDRAAVWGLGAGKYPSLA